MRFARRSFTAPLSAIAVGLAIATAVAACSGSVTPIADVRDADVSSTDGATSDDGGSSGTVKKDASVDGSSPVPGKDAGPTGVTEKPAPDCHDLVQQANLVTPVGTPNSPPPPGPITTITPGTYVLVSATDFDGQQPIKPVFSSKTTVVFTATRQYYLSESDGSTTALTLEWKITEGRLLRKVLCAQQPGSIGTTVDYRIDAAPKGFVIYVPDTQSSRVHGYRYEQRP